MEIHWTHADDVSDPQRDAIESRLQALGGEHSDLIDVRIAVRSSEHHRRGGQEVRITCQARGKEIVAARTRDEVGLALDEAIDVFEREVWRMRHRRNQTRGERPAEPPEMGIVDRVFEGEGYGFIITDAGERVYFHRNAVHGSLRFDQLSEGQRVGLDIEGGEKGLQATVVLPPPPGTA